MDRRRLILTAASLGAGGLAPELIGKGAFAQTQLPPARASDEAPPVYTPPSYSPPPSYPGQGSAASGYASPAYQPPAYQTSPSARGGYTQPAYQTQPPRSPYDSPAYSQGVPEGRAPGADGYDRQTATPPPPTPRVEPTYSAQTQAETYSRDELVNSVSDFLGVTAEAAGAAIERIFRENGRPTGYIAGEEGAIAFTGGLRYGKGLLYMKNRQPGQVYWQGPSIGFDIRINASRVFTLCYNLQYPDAIFRRFPRRGGVGLFHRRRGRELSAGGRHRSCPYARGPRPWGGGQHRLSGLQPQTPLDPALIVLTAPFTSNLAPRRPFLRDAKSDSGARCGARDHRLVDAGARRAAADPRGRGGDGEGAG